MGFTILSSAKVIHLFQYQYTFSEENIFQGIYNIINFKEKTLIFLPIIEFFRHVRYLLENTHKIT